MTPTRAASIGALLTILLIAGTLTSCGRYGRPVRTTATPHEVGSSCPAQSIDPGAAEREVGIRTRVERPENHWIAA